MFAQAVIIAVIMAFVIGTAFNMNVGLLCIIAGYFASLLFGPAGNGSEIIKSIPVDTIVLSVGVLFMFQVANKNGTIEKICNFLLKLVKGKKVFMPFTFALVGFLITAAGSSGVNSTALMCAPSATMAKKTKIDPSLFAICTMHGIFAGHFVPISGMAVNVNSQLAKLGITDMALKLMGWNIAVEFILVFVAFAMFGGLKLLRDGDNVYKLDAKESDTTFNVQNWISLLSIVILILNIFTLKLNLGIVAAVLGLINIIVARIQGTKGVSDNDVIRSVPWNSVVMVIGAMSIVALMQTAGSTQLIVDGIHSLNIGIFSILLIIMAAGLISYYSVSVPVIVAMIPLIIEFSNSLQRPEWIPGAIAAVCVAAVIVDVSPMSNNGAMFLAAASAIAEDQNSTQIMFKKLLGYGASLIVFGSLLCWLLLVVLGL